jgi:hypothetical protein
VDIVVIQLQQERVGHIHLQLAQVVEGGRQFLVRLLAQRHGAVVAGKGLDVGHQRIDALFRNCRLAGMDLERLVDIADLGISPGLHRQVVAHEAVEVLTVGLLTEATSMGRQWSS